MIRYTTATQKDKDPFLSLALRQKNEYGWPDFEDTTFLLKRFLILKLEFLSTL